MSKKREGAVVAIEAIASRIALVRGQKVMLDADLAALYGTTTKRLNEQVRRDAERLPADFMFRLSREEWESLRSQFATLKAGRGEHRKYLPHAFTEHGALMAAMVLNSARAPSRAARIPCRAQARSPGRNHLRDPRRDPPTYGPTRETEATDRVRHT